MTNPADYSPSVESVSQPDDNDLTHQQQAFAEVSAKLGSFTPKRMLCFIELETARSLRQISNVTGLPSSTIKSNLAAVAAAFGEQLYRTNKGVYTLTEGGRHVAETFRQILDMQETLVEQRQALMVRYLPHHCTTVLPAAAAAQDRGHDVELSVLGEHHRSVDHFISRAIRPLLAGSYDVVIGVDLPDMSGEPAGFDDSLVSTFLYRAWLEVMVPSPERSGIDPTAFVERGEEGDFVSLPRLQAARVPILTSPPGTRSRTYLDRAVDPTTPLAVKMAEYESKVLVVGAHAGLGIPILPSDVALQFDYRPEGHRSAAYRGPLAGSEAQHWRWLPLVDVDDEKISYRVVGHRRKEKKPDPMAELFIRDIADVVSDVMMRAHRAEAIPDRMA